MGESKNGTSFLWFLAGAVIGAGVALLYAPQSGVETRRKIKDASSKVAEDIREKYEKISDDARRSMEQMKASAEKAMGNVKSLFEGAKEDIKEKIEEVPGYMK
ncbi:MAG: YtxH domain-containing protein [Acidobacteria bacterium]|jgi:gas vesicle protein|nr:YtxH domain-containing protein [Acidobacteriota bacterium]